MVVRKTIHHLRQQPHEDRHTVALALAGVAVIILFLAWTTFFFRALGSSQVAAVVESATTTDQSLSPYTSLDQANQDLSQAFASSSDQFRQIRDQAYQAARAADEVNAAASSTGSLDLSTSTPY